MALEWTTTDAEALKKALASGILEVEYEGPPRRRVKYQDLSQMRELYREMVAAVSRSSGAPTCRPAQFSKGTE